MKTNKSWAGMKTGGLLFVIALSISAILIETGARVVHAYSENMLNSKLISSIMPDGSRLDAYEISVPETRMHWRLKPGFRSQMLGQETLTQSGESTRGQQEISDDNLKIAINQKGFRGPELRLDGSHLRILMLGDSVTFGRKRISYPQIVADVLIRKGKDIEIVNGGVEGYSSRNLLLESPRYVSLSPDVVTVMIGWNDIFNWRALANRWERYFRTIWLLRLSWSTLQRTYLGASEYAKKMLLKKSVYSNESIDAATIAVSMSDFELKLTQLIMELRPTGAKIILLTLPSLYEIGLTPSEKALAIGHLPEFTANPNVLAKIVSQYNTLIRNMATQQNLALIDTARWSSENLSPKENYFKDTVHLNANGLTLLAEFLAADLVDRLSLPSK